MLDTGYKHWGVLLELEALWGRRKKNPTQIYNCKLQQLLQRELSPDPEHEKASDGFTLRPVICLSAC